MTGVRRCRDCVADGVATLRPTPHPGPRCVSHWRKVVAVRKAANHDRRVQMVYGLGEGDYERLLAAQGGVCAGCGPESGRNGRSKRLAVDHNHETGEVRGLLCSEDNRLLGRLRDNPAPLLRLAAYLVDPPARKVLRPNDNP
ncbi:endonuclease VII domain-containing protein [Amycolatopsis kentuckyensis]|uniref:endonuclease VII domain-containing protein n=1 Tax=Amycolatopsis kentuckyensis TaxID=218823 RepID=UPI000A3B0D5B|nr:endonuclease VII domain-containing protein [Amycolatopsis kentuckyensis]